MRAWALLLGLLHWRLLQHGSDGKRFDPSMVDPLMRRSPLDKNFMRFGRSSPAYSEEDEAEDRHDSSPDVETSKEENFLRSMRGKDNFIRFGRGRNDNFIRFGRGKQDNFMRFGRGSNGNFMRFGRGKQDNFMRFGRGKQDNFMRLGRGKQDNFMRFGRGKQDNFMRFGRNLEGDVSDTYDKYQSLEPEISRESRGKQDNFMRFGKSFSHGGDGSIPIAMRSLNPKSNSNFIRFGRARQDSFMRFGKADGGLGFSQFVEDLDDNLNKDKDSSDYQSSTNNNFKRGAKAKNSDLLRFGRHPTNKDDSFMRFGRNSQGQPEEESSNTDFIPQRLKRSVSEPYDAQDEIYPSKFQVEQEDHIIIPLSSLPDDSENDFSSPHEEEYTSRNKRSLSFIPSTATPLSEEDSVDYVYTKIRFDSPPKPEYHSSLLSAGIPNVIVGPEFSLLPDLDPPSSMLKKSRPGDQNFLRLG